MTRATRRLVRAGLWFMLVICVPAAAGAGPAADPGTLYVFWSMDCPVCLRQKPYLEELSARYPALRVQALEISRSTEHHGLFRQLAAERGITPGFVPTLVFRDRAWVGDSDDLRASLEAELTAAMTADAALSTASGPPGLRLPWVGDLDTHGGSLVLLTTLIAFVDGFNPCSLWVLTLLLGLVINSGSRRRVALVGLTFLTTTALIYGAFVAGIFSVLTVTIYLGWVQAVVAAFALVFGLVNIKDYFWFKRGFSFTIADSHKPGIYRGLRRLRQDGGSSVLLMATTVVMAAGIAIVELPCTAGFPVVWSGILAARSVPGIEFLGLLALYIGVYLLFELVLFFSALATLSMGRFEERQGRLLKLYGGTIMVALAVALVASPELMASVGGSLLLFMAAIIVATAVLLVHRRLQPAT
jgi:cytochrome c biogenesis protein CcdA